MTRTYTEMSLISDFQGRLNYLILKDYRYDSPRKELAEFYKTHTWKSIAKMVTTRDNRFDLGVFGVFIPDRMMVHHIQPVTIKDLVKQTPLLTDMDNLVTVSLNTHNIIHYGEPSLYVERKPGDTILW